MRILYNPCGFVTDFRPAKGGILIDVFIGEFRNNFQSISHQILPLRQYILNQSVYLDFERFSLLKYFLVFKDDKGSFGEFRDPS